MINSFFELKGNKSSYFKRLKKDLEEIKSEIKIVFGLVVSFKEGSMVILKERFIKLT